MKKLIIMILIINNLYSSSDLNQSSLDMFLFKIGFTSLLSEFENEKNTTRTNTKLINDLELKVKSMMDTKSNNIISNTFKNNNNEYEIKIKNLENKINTLQNKLNDILNKKEKIIYIKKEEKKLKYLSAYIGVNEANIHITTSKFSKVLKVLYRNDTLKLEYCNRYGWCKIYKDSGFIAKYKLKF